MTKPISLFDHLIFTRPDFSTVAIQFEFQPETRDLGIVLLSRAAPDATPFRAATWFEDIGSRKPLEFFFEQDFDVFCDRIFGHQKLTPDFKETTDFLRDIAQTGETVDYKISEDDRLKMQRLLRSVTFDRSMSEGVNCIHLVNRLTTSGITAFESGAMQLIQKRYSDESKSFLTDVWKPLTEELRQYQAEIDNRQLFGALDVTVTEQIVIPEEDPYEMTM